MNRGRNTYDRDNSVAGSSVGRGNSRSQSRPADPSVRSFQNVPAAIAKELRLAAATKRLVEKFLRHGPNAAPDAIAEDNNQVRNQMKSISIALDGLIDIRRRIGQGEFRSSKGFSKSGALPSTHKRDVYNDLHATDTQKKNAEAELEHLRKLKAKCDDPNREINLKDRISQAKQVLKEKEEEFRTLKLEIAKHARNLEGRGSVGRGGAGRGNDKYASVESNTDAKLYRDVQALAQERNALLTKLRKTMEDEEKLAERLEKLEVVRAKWSDEFINVKYRVQAYAPITDEDVDYITSPRSAATKLNRTAGSTGNLHLTNDIKLKEAPRQSKMGGRAVPATGYQSLKVDSMVTLTSVTRKLEVADQGVKRIAEERSREEYQHATKVETLHNEISTSEAALAAAQDKAAALTAEYERLLEMCKEQNITPGLHHTMGPTALSASTKLPSLIPKGPGGGLKARRNSFKEAVEAEPSTSKTAVPPPQKKGSLSPLKQPLPKPVEHVAPTKQVSSGPSTATKDTSLLTVGDRSAHAGPASASPSHKSSPRKNGLFEDKNTFESPKKKTPARSASSSSSSSASSQSSSDYKDDFSSPSSKSSSSSSSDSSSDGEEDFDTPDLPDTNNVKINSTVSSPSKASPTRLPPVGLSTKVSPVPQPSPRGLKNVMNTPGRLGEAEEDDFEANDVKLSSPSGNKSKQSPPRLPPPKSNTKQPRGVFASYSDDEDENGEGDGDVNAKMAAAIAGGQKLRAYETRLEDSPVRGAKSSSSSPAKKQPATYGYGDDEDNEEEVFESPRGAVSGSNASPRFKLGFGGNDSDDDYDDDDHFEDDFEDDA